MNSYTHSKSSEPHPTRTQHVEAAVTWLMTERGLVFNALLVYMGVSCYGKKR